MPQRIGEKPVTKEQKSQKLKEAKPKQQVKLEQADIAKSTTTASADPISKDSSTVNPNCDVCYEGKIFLDKAAIANTEVNWQVDVLDPIEWKKANPFVVLCEGVKQSLGRAFLIRGQNQNWFKSCLMEKGCL